VAIHCIKASRPLSMSGRLITRLPASKVFTEPALNIRVDPLGAPASASSMSWYQYLNQALTLLEGTHSFADDGPLGFGVIGDFHGVPGDIRGG